MLRIYYSSFFIVFLLAICSCSSEELTDDNANVITLNKNGTTITIDSLSNIGLPLLIVETVNSEEPTFERAPKHDGTNGSTIINATKVPGRLLILEGGSFI